MKITDKDRLDFFGGQGYEKIDKIELNDPKQGCLCGMCRGVGMYFLNDEFEHEIMAWGEDFREAIDNAIMAMRESNK